MAIQNHVSPWLHCPCTHTVLLCPPLSKLLNIILHDPCLICRSVLLLAVANIVAFFVICCLLWSTTSVLLQSSRSHGYKYFTCLYWFGL